MVNVALIGLRASGKTTIGALIAESLGMSFVDTDQRVLSGFQESTVVDVWRVHGEGPWRTAEAAEAAQAFGRDEQVISMGGGMPIIPEVSDRIRREQAADHLVVVYLDVAVDVLESRLDANLGDRPALSDGVVRDDVAFVHRERDPVYRSLADMICFVSSPETAQETSARLLAMLTG
ncbi:MAG: hypothetical protein CMJ24_07665 [Phycisphaerae bacterium]|nr:hypothetical protein [Phycisphaerae bacterium]|tara:strand:+ start:2285 stop:2815 length:531 start_codon:yes stop_codon:yes gene_type:complete